MSHGTQVYFNKPETIIVPEGRKLRATGGQIEMLASSIADVGLINPITITSDRVLISGLHRLRAWEQAMKGAPIPCLVTRLDAVRAEIAEIDENELRHEEDVLVRAQKQKRRKELYESLHPETKKGGDRSRVQSFQKVQENQGSEGLSVTRDALVPTFAEDAAAKRGVKPREIQREVQIAEDLDDEAQEALQGTKTANSKRQLLDLAREPKKKQREIAATIKSGKAKTIKEAKEKLATKKPAPTDETPDLPEWPLTESVVTNILKPLEAAIKAVQVGMAQLLADGSPSTLRTYRSIVGMLEVQDVEHGTAAAPDLRQDSRLLQDLAGRLRLYVPHELCPNCKGARVCPGKACRGVRGESCDCSDVCACCSGRGFHDRSSRPRKDSYWRTAA